MSNTAYSCAAVTPSDTVDIATGVCQALYIGVGGDVAVWTPGSSAAVVHKGVGAGQTLLIQAKRVSATGTTATDIIAWYA